MSMFRGVFETRMGDRRSMGRLKVKNLWPWLEKFNAASAGWKFRNRINGPLSVIGRFTAPLLPPRPRSAPEPSSLAPARDCF